MKDHDDYAQSSYHISLSNSHKATVRQKVYCICRRIKSGYMIQCDCCSEWFHGQCVGIREGYNPGVYLCNFCCQDDWLACEMLLLLSDKQSIQKFFKAQKEYSKTRKFPDTDVPSEDYDDQSIEIMSDDENDDETVLFPSSTENLNFIEEDGISPRDQRKEEKPPGSPTLEIHLSPNPSPNLNLTSSSLNHKSKKRKNETVLNLLMKYYETTPDPDLITKKKIADETNLSVKQVSDWFYNLRVRKKYKVNVN